MKYANRLIIILLTSLFINSSLQAQKIETSEVNGYKIVYNGQFYKYMDMDHIFKQNDLAYKQYIQAANKYKTAKTLGIVSGLGLGIGVIGAASINEDDDFGSAFGNGLLAMLGVIIAIPTGIVALTTEKSGNKNKKRSIELFNESYGIRLPESDHIELSLVLKNGIGLQLRF